MSKHENWFRGSKSFVDMHRIDENGNIKDSTWVEAPEGEQLPESVFKKLRKKFAGMVAQNPNGDWYFTRYDHEDVVPENANNAPLHWDGEKWTK